MILFKACPINIRIFSLFLNNIYISRLQEEIELFSSMERSPLELNRLVMEFACIKTDGRPSNLAKSLKSAGVTWFCSPVHPPYCLVLARCSFARKIYRYTKLSIHHELPYRIFISLVSIGHCLTYRQPTVGPIRAGREYRSPVPRPFQPQCRQHSSRLW